MTVFREFGVYVPLPRTDLHNRVVHGEGIVGRALPDSDNKLILFSASHNIDRVGLDAWIERVQSAAWVAFRDLGRVLPIIGNRDHVVEVAKVNITPGRPLHLKRHSNDLASLALYYWCSPQQSLDTLNPHSTVEEFGHA